MSKQLTALIFDVDGTLADTEKQGHRVAFNFAFKQSGLDWVWSEELYGQLLAITGGKERIRHYLNLYHPDFVLPNDDFIPNLHKQKTYFYTELLQQGNIPLRTGVLRLLSEARQRGLRLAIATTTTPANVFALLEHTMGKASIDWFDVIAAGDIVPAKKPAPDIYDYTLDKMQLSPAQCLAFEDSENGIESALQAGLATIITVNDYTKNHDFTGACLVVDHLGDSQKPCQVFAGQATKATTITEINVDVLSQLHQQC